MAPGRPPWPRAPGRARATRRSRRSPSARPPRRGRGRSRRARPRRPRRRGRPGAAGGRRPPASPTSVTPSTRNAASSSSADLPGRSGRLLPRRAPRRPRAAAPKPDDRRRVLETGPSGALLLAPEDQRRETATRCDHQRADAGRSAELVRAERHELRAELAKVERHPPDRRGTRRRAVGHRRSGRVRPPGGRAGASPPRGCPIGSGRAPGGRPSGRARRPPSRSRCARSSRRQAR